MKERPILFSGEMVKALLAGTKTQTRRIVKADIHAGGVKRVNLERFGCQIGFRGTIGDGEMIWTPCPFGVAGDRLWVRETFSDDYKPFIYRSGAVSEFYGGEKIKWRSPYHMRRISSRITLEITKVRVERLQSISEEDAGMEGAPRETIHSMNNTARMWYRDLWDSLHDKGAWDKNSWVFVVEFRRL